MQEVLIIPKTEFQTFVDRLERLETFARAVQETPKTNKLLTVRETANRLRMTEDSVRKARRQGRLQGKKLNEKEWGFYETEIERYLNRYNRQHRPT